MLVILRQTLRPWPRYLAVVALAASAAAQPTQSSGGGRTLQRAPLASEVPFAPAREVPYAALDNVEGPWINLNVVPIRPMVQTADGRDLYALNTNASLVQHYDNLSGAPAATYRVPWGPVSIALGPGAAGDELLVVCRGTHVLVRLERATGRTLALVDLPFEPGDLLVDTARRRAFVACSGVDSVVEVDLATNAVAATYAIPSKHPLFLARGLNGTDVLVAPLFSGNNSVVPKDGVSIQALGNVLDLDAAPQAFRGLPDEDLFRIDPLAGTVEPVLRGTGTVLFAHGVNPATGLHWQLNTEARNKDPERQSEAALRGIAVQNRLTIAALPPPGTGPAGEHLAVLDLDDVDPATPGTQHDRAQSVGQPYALTFAADGSALVTGVLTDSVTELTSHGAFQGRIELEAGSIPRQALYRDADTVLVHCWGTSRVEVWRRGAGWDLDTTLDLGPDPTPPLVREGRAIFYDASHSLHNNQSCASCHVEGRTDMTVWNLSETGLDDKGPMVTQTLAGIDKSPPYHWRGERATLLDFNPAFPALLGGTPLDTQPGPNGGPSEFEAFQAFVFSIQATANPNQHPRRVVSDAYGGDSPAGVPRGSATRGQELFLQAPTDGGLTCNFCHALPNGTTNDSTADAPDDPRPKRTSFEVTAFTELWRKEQPTVSLELADGTEPRYAVLGAGLTHAGVFPELFGFVRDFFELEDQEAMDLAAFVRTVDQGLAPYVHRAVLLTPEGLPEATLALGVLMDQAARRNVDVAVYGPIDFGIQPVPLAWFWDRETGLFEAETRKVSPRDLAFLLDQVREGSSLVFVGLPVGMGRPWAADFDDDLLLNLDEPLFRSSPYDPDTDGDGAPDGHEVSYDGDPADPAVLPVDREPPVVRNLRVQWVTARVAKLAWETDEPTSYRIEIATDVGDARRVRGDAPRIVHSAIVGELFASGPGGKPLYEYYGTLTSVDLAGNVTQVTTPPFATLPGHRLEGEAMLGDLRWTETALTGRIRRAPSDPRAAPPFEGRAAVQVRRKAGGPPYEPLANYVVVATVLVNGERSEAFTSPRPSSFTVFGKPPALEGPFVLSAPTGSDGTAELAFDVGGLAQGDQVVLVIEAVVPVDPQAYDPTQPDFGGPGIPQPLGLWDFPATPPAARALSITL